MMKQIGTPILHAVDNGRGPAVHRGSRPGRPAFVLAAALLALGGCAGPGITPLKSGLTEPEVRSLWGAPTGRYALPAGTRLEYATGPAGVETWMVDLDPSGRATTWQQVLTPRHLESVQGRLPGMTQDELLRTLGRASEVRSGGRQGGQVWSWRHDSPFCLWFQASLGDDGRVRDAAFAPDPQCDANNDHDR
jgi:hypothetical protein